MVEEHDLVDAVLGEILPGAPHPFLGGVRVVEVRGPTELVAVGIQIRPLEHPAHALLMATIMLTARLTITSSPARRSAGTPSGPSRPGSAGRPLSATAPSTQP